MLRAGFRGLHIITSRSCRFIVGRIIVGFAQLNVHDVHIYKGPRLSRCPLPRVLYAFTFILPVSFRLPTRTARLKISAYASRPSTMKFTSVLVAIATTLSAFTQALVYNKEQAYQPGNFDKYKYVRQYSGVPRPILIVDQVHEHIQVESDAPVMPASVPNRSSIPPPIVCFENCLLNITQSANLRDGCAYDDLTCHCVNYDVYSPVILSLFFDGDTEVMANGV